MSARTRLLVIDPQADFCDGPSPGALAVPGADADMTRLAGLVDRLDGGLAGIDVTLDSHRVVDIAHPAWWTDADGRQPAPFTLISVADVEQGKWRARQPALPDHGLDYVRALERGGKYALVIWPPHCLVGTPGHAVHAGLFAALRRWEESHLIPVNFVFKGDNPLTEHYSALAAEIPDPADPATLPNRALLDRLADCDRLLIAGEASSHCVRATIADIAHHLGPTFLRRCVLVADCTSPVPVLPGGPDFPALAAAFIGAMADQGMATAKAAAIG